VGALLYTVFSSDGLLQWSRLKTELAEITAENEALREQNDRLKAETQRLQSDRGAIERAVRQELGYTKSDEIVFKFAPAGTDSTKGRK
jgi:cell division protein FtsB